MPTLLHLGYSMVPSIERSRLKLTINSYTIGEGKVRTVFTIEVSTDISVSDEKRRKAFIDLMRKASKTLYAQTAMLSDKPTVDISIQSDDSVNGVSEIPLFENKP